ncbi:MAG: tetratricopeptide repeat protein [Candidatus Hydrogenedens sp.]|nr:tetratricopeptide repeat protein [Candidatus Hydrogenedentota bacterium]NLF59451.1 tetratricopeptide repeat protein [Candidatus Hydrogenedens sp.]
MGRFIKFSGFALSVLAGGCAAMGGFDLFLGDNWGRPAQATREARAYTHYLASVMQERRGRVDLAIDSLNQAVALDPEAVTPTLGLVRAYRRQGDLAGALKMSQRAVSLDPARADLWIIQGESLHALERYEEAIASFNKAIELQPDDMLGYGALVEIQEQRNDLVAAVDIYERIIRRNPESAVLYYQLGLTLVRINDRDGAIAAFRKVLELEPRVARAHYLLALMLIDADQHDEAVAQLRHYLDVRPDNFAALEPLAGALARMGQPDEAAAAMIRLLGSGAAQPKHFLQTAWLLFRVGRHEEARRLLPETGAPLLARMINALCLKAAGKDVTEEIAAMDALDADIEQECNDHLSEILRLFGVQDAGSQLLALLGRFDRDGASPGRVLSFVRARVLVAMEKYEEAVPALDALLAGYGPDRWVHYHLAVCQEKLKNDAEVERNLKIFLEAEPDNAEVLNFLGYFYAERGINLKEAEELLLRALKIEPDSAYYLDSIGWVYYQQGRYKEALDHIQRAIYGMGTDDAVLRDHLGDVYLKLGDTERALGEWRRALRLDPKMDEVRLKIRKHAKQDK